MVVIFIEMSRYNPFNVDESKIVKKEKQNNNQQTIKEEIKIINSTSIKQENNSQLNEQPPVEQINKIDDTIKQQLSTEQTNTSNIQETLNNIPSNEKIIENYFDIINNYIDKSGTIAKEQLPDRKETVNNILQDVYQQSKTPVYNYSKDMMTGKINIIPKKSEETIQKQTIENKETANNIPKQEIKKLLEETNRNIIRTKIELRIHVELIQNPKNESKRKWYESKIKTFKDDLEYLTQRKLILEKM